MVGEWEDVGMGIPDTGGVVHVWGQGSINYPYPLEKIEEEL